MSASEIQMLPPTTGEEKIHDLHPNLLKQQTEQTTSTINQHIQIHRNHSQSNYNTIQHENLFHLQRQSKGYFASLARKRCVYVL